MSRLGIIDTHAHLDDNRFDADRADVMARLTNDMEAVITQGTTYESSVAIRKIWPASKTKATLPDWSSWPGTIQK